MLAVSGKAAEAPADEEQIRKLENDWVRALENYDREGLNRIVAPGFIFIEPDRMILNRDAYLADRSTNASDIASFEISELKARVFGNSALVTGIAKIDERRRGKHYRFGLRWKELRVKEEGNWKVLAGQATPVNPKWDAPFIVPQ
jgi:ketosteroid isomerase-like protein